MEEERWRKVDWWTRTKIKNKWFYIVRTHSNLFEVKITTETLSGVIGTLIKISTISV